MPCRMKLSNKLNTVPEGKICAGLDFFFMLNMAYWDLSLIKSILDKECVLIHFVNRANNNTKVFVLVNLFDKCFVEKHVEVFIRTKTHGLGLSLIEKIISFFEKIFSKPRNCFEDVSPLEIPPWFDTQGTLTTGGHNFPFRLTRNMFHYKDSGTYR